jgi:vacuolar iron transporter family protein
MKFKQWVGNYYRSLIRELKDNLNNFSFGSVSAVITSLALITGLDTSSDAKYAIVGSLMIIALADNVSDTLGIHIYKEGESVRLRDVWRSTLANFVCRLMVTLGFIIFVIALSPLAAMWVSITYGFLILSLVSYAVARKRNIPAKPIILEHLLIAVMVVCVSKYLSFRIPHKAF